VSNVGSAVVSVVGPALADSVALSMRGELRYPDLCREHDEQTLDSQAPLHGDRVREVGGDVVAELEWVVERCAGIDVHRAQLRVRVRSPGQGRRRTRLEEFATFGTTPDLLEVSEWLSQHDVTHVAMEGTGVYGKPVVRHEAQLDRVG
jgi:hypothetical protein